MEHKILIVDDERSLVQVLRRTLQFEFPDAQIDVAYSGEEGLSRLAEEAYDLIIADLRMPGFDGLELIRGVRYLNPDVPIILATGYGTDEARRGAAQLARGLVSGQALQRRRPDRDGETSADKQESDGR